MAGGTSPPNPDFRFISDVAPIAGSVVADGPTKTSAGVTRPVLIFRDRALKYTLNSGRIPLCRKADPDFSTVLGRRPEPAVLSPDRTRFELNLHPWTEVNLSIR